MVISAHKQLFKRNVKRSEEEHVWQEEALYVSTPGPAQQHISSGVVLMLQELVIAGIPFGSQCFNSTVYIHSSWFIFIYTYTYIYTYLLSTSTHIYIADLSYA